MLVSKKSNEDDVRWVYLDIGKFGGLAETMDELIRYAIKTPRDGAEMALACSPARPATRPTCSTSSEPYLLPGQPRDRRQGADRRHGRLYGDLLGDRVQRLRTAEDGPHLTSPGAGRCRLPSRHTRHDNAVGRCRGGEGVGHDHDSQGNDEGHRGARGAARPRLRRRPLRQGRRAAARRTHGGRRAVVCRSGQEPRRRHRPALARFRRAGAAGASARPACGRRRAARPRDRRSSRCGAPPRPRGNSATRPCCWSATRRTTAASASPPRRPARCGCPAPTSAIACSRLELVPGALDGARGLIGATGEPMFVPDLATLDCGAVPHRRRTRAPDIDLTRNRCYERAHPHDRLPPPPRAVRRPDRDDRLRLDRPRRAAAAGAPHRLRSLQVRRDRAGRQRPKPARRARASASKNWRLLAKTIATCSRRFSPAGRGAA